MTKKAAKTKKTAKKPAKKSKAAKKPKDTRFIMVIEPAFKTKIRAFAKKKGLKMSAWAREAFAKAMR